MTFANHIRELNTRFNPTEDFPAGLVREISAAPDAGTTPFTLFIIDNSSDAVYWNPTRDIGGWTLLVDASLIGSGGTILTATP